MNLHGNHMQKILSLLGNKWTLPCLTAIESADKPIHYSEIENKITGISQKMLSQTLRALEQNGLLHRKFIYGVPPQTEYTLTTKGQELMSIIHQLSEWTDKYPPSKESSE